jgi:hypothetical protein
MVGFNKSVMNNIRYKIVFLFLILSFSAFAQPEPDSTKAKPATVQKPNSGFIPLPIDTTRLEYFHWNNITNRSDLYDTLLQDFQQYDAARQGLFYDYVHIGDVGSAATPLAFTPIKRRGFEVGIHTYDIYQRPYSEVRFFDVNKAYSHAYYSQATSSQEDLIFSATFANNFKSNRGNISLDYDRISEIGLYGNQFSRHTNLAINGWFQNKTKRYTGLWAWVQNVNEQEMNGGVADTSNLYNAGQFNTRINVETNLSAAKSNLRNNQFIYTQYFSLLPNSKNLKLKHRAEFQTFEYKYYDTSPALDSAFYGNFQTNNVGIRNYIQYNKIENEATVHLDYKGSLDVGAVHSVYLLNQEPLDTTINNLFLIGDWDLVLGEKQNYGLQVKAHFGLLDNRADYLLQGDLFLGFAKDMRLKISAYSRAYQPTLQQHQLFVSQQQLWQNDFNKTIENKVGGRFDWTKNFAVEGNYYLINNLIYWDDLALPQQTDSIVNIGQLLVHYKLNIGNFHLDNSAVLQQTDNNILRFPTIATKHSLYFEGNLFRDALFGRVGLDFRFNTNYYFDAFQPITQQFHQQNDWEMSMLPIADAFVSFKVRSFRAFVKLENINQLIDNDQIYYSAPNYPIRDWTIRFGVSWYFTDGLEDLQNLSNGNNNNGGSGSGRPAGVGGF